MSARAAEERFRGLVESIEAIPYISEWDARGTIRYISPQVEAVLGYAPERWYAGADVWEDNLHPDDRERVLAASARTYTEQRDFACEYRMHAADGRVVWIAERETIVRDAEARPSFCRGVMFDVTRLKTTEERLVAAEAALREERDLARRYLEVARTLLLVLDVDGSVRLLNQYGHELLGYPPGSLVGCDWFGTMLPLETRGAVRDAYAGGMETTSADRSRRRRERVGAAHRDRRAAHDRLAPHGAAGPRRPRHRRARVGRGHHGPAAGRGGDPPPGVHRSAHGPGEPLALRRRAARRGGRGRPGRAAVRGPRRVQGRQRHARPRGGRRTAARGRGPARERDRRRGGRPARRGRVPRAAAVAPGERAGRRARRGGRGDGAARRAVRAWRAARCEIRASVGCAVFPHDAGDADALLRRADAEMYRIKWRSRAQEPGR